MAAVLSSLKSIYQSRNMILSLGINDFRTKYAGSFFGILWAFVQPITTVLVFWLVFTVGFRQVNGAEGPFLLWLITGLIPWFYFAEIIGSGSQTFIEYSYLVKKVVFKIYTLPLVKSISATIVHVIFILVMLAVSCLYDGYRPSIYSVQIIYFSFCLFLFATSLVLITSSLIIFFRDFGQIIAIFLQFGMWLTPILWPISMVPAHYQWIPKLNPLWYIVDGYRQALLSRTWFFKDLTLTFYFWGCLLITFLIGIIVMKKLKPHFADVL